MESCENAKIFIDIYNKLDDYMNNLLIKHPKINPNADKNKYVSYKTKVILLSNENLIRNNFKEELISYGNLRNAIVHKYEIGKKKEERIIAQPLISEVENFERMRSIIMSPPKAFEENMVIRKDAMYYASITDKVTQVVSKMNKEKYSYVPILKDDKLIGVFSQDTLFTFVAQNEGFILEDSLELDEFGELLEIDNHSSERFEFIPRSSTVLDIDQKFKEDYKQEKRLEAIFITENGHHNEKILGLTTIWDLAQYKSKVNNMF